MRRALGRWASVALLSLLGGCDDGGEAVDAAPPDAAVDGAPIDGMPDGTPGAIADGAPVDGASDGTPDAEADAAPDTLPDALPDARWDAMSDAMPADAAPDAAPDATPDAAPLDPVSLAYCDCMLLTCHDLYHLLWGEDEGVARRRCFEIADGLPRMPGATEGPNVHCRRHWCAAAFDEDDLELCDRAGGLEVCR